MFAKASNQIQNTTMEDESHNGSLAVDHVSHYEALLGQTKKIDHRESNVRNWSIDFGRSISMREEKANLKPTSSQFMALIKKSVALQAKQKGTNICQLLTPIVCLLFVLLIKQLLYNTVQKKFSFELPFPFIHSMPLAYLFGSHSPIFGNTEKNVSSPIHLSSCLQWYLYDFANKDDHFIQDYVGGDEHNMLSNRHPPIWMTTPLYACGKSAAIMPEFRRTGRANNDEDIYENLKILNKNGMGYDGEVANLSILPDGAVTFYEANKRNLTFKLQINDLRLSSMHRNNGVTKYKGRAVGDKKPKSQMIVVEGQLNLLDLITKSYIQGNFSDVATMSGSQIMPLSVSGDVVLANIMNIAGATLYPIALSLLLPVFMYTMVVEKEERLREIMKMSGLRTANYWAATYAWCLFVYLISVLVFFLFGKFILVADFFASTNFFVLAVTFLGWGLSQASLAIFYQNFIAKARTATIAGYLIALWTTMVGATFSIIVFPNPQPLPVFMLIYPPFAFTRIVYYLSLKCGSPGCISSFSQLSGEMGHCILVLYIGALLFFILAMYLDQVLPKEYGVRKHPLFFIKALIPKTNKILRNPFAKSDYQIKKEQKLIGDESEQVTKSFIDNSGVQEEKSFVEVLQPPFYKCPLVIKNLRKVYAAVGGKPAKVAVQDLTLHIRKGETFGLLGPNGAGKTSLIAMLTGLYPPESGNAWIGGYSIIDQIDDVHTQIGVCPQFDLLWPDLTVREHLLFYARIRGIEKEEEKTVVDKALKEVYLTNFASFQTKQLSGGMKRRLSVALALVGDPKIIYLDEPTTGLDPENRRQLWNILVEAKGDKAIVLTTHSMEEADVLCTRIGIMTNGSIQCIGSQAKLKNKYGGGYHLFINCYKDGQLNQSMYPNGEHAKSQLDQRCDAVKQYISELLPKSQMKTCFNGNFIYSIPTEGLEVSRVFQNIESKKVELEISDWGISQCTLEDVFMEIVEVSEAREEELQ